MTQKIITLALLAIVFLFSGCASTKRVYETHYTHNQQFMPINVNDNIKQQYKNNVQNQLTLYHTVLLNIKIHHPQYKLLPLTNAIDNYVHTFVSPILSESNTEAVKNSSGEDLKLYLTTVSLYYNCGDENKAKQYLELFYKRFDTHQNLSDLTLNCDDIGYSTLGEGIRIMEKQLHFVRASMTR